MFLSKKEVQQMTRAVQTAKVCRTLSSMGIKFKPDHDGFPIVLRESVVAAFLKGAARRREPNYAAMETINGKAPNERQHPS